MSEADIEAAAKAIRNLRLTAWYRDESALANAALEAAGLPRLRADRDRLLAAVNEIAFMDPARPIADAIAVAVAASNAAGKPERRSMSETRIEMRIARLLYAAWCVSANGCHGPALLPNWAKWHADAHLNSVGLTRGDFLQDAKDYLAGREVADRLRAELAQARAEAERLREELHYANGTCDLAMKHRDAAEAENEKLREALKPFAEWAAIIDRPRWPDAWSISETPYDPEPTMGDLRRARAALRPPQPVNDPELHELHDTWKKP